MTPVQWERLSSSKCLILAASAGDAFGMCKWRSLPSDLAANGRTSLRTQYIEQDPPRHCVAHW